MRQNLVFIVVPVYNTEALLPRCVDSLRKQSHKNLRIVLVDDGATDTSGAICDRYADADDRIHVIHKPNGGLSDARNAGIAYCMEQSTDHGSDYLALVDSDDFIHPDFISRLLEICEENDCDGAQCRYERGSGDAFTQNSPANLELTDGRGALLGYRIKTICQTKLYRLVVYEKEYFRKGVLNEDEFFTYRLIYKCRRFAFTDEAMYYYYERPGSIMWQMQKKLRDNPHRFDWLKAFRERADFFRSRGEKALEQRTYEKVCIELMLRYTEQMVLPRAERDEAVNSGEYLRLYREHYRKMISLRSIPAVRKLIYTAFYICPATAVAVSKIRPLRN